MAVTLERLAEGIRRANAAGDTETVRKLGTAYRQMQSAPAPAASEPAQGNVLQLTGKVSDLPSRQPQKPDLLSSTLATVNGLSASVPFLQGATDSIGGGISALLGGDFDEYVNRQRGIREGLAKQAPLARGAGELAGYIAAPLAAGSTKIGAEALGLTGGLTQRIANSGLSGAGLATADALSRGERGADALTSGATGGVLGALLPGVGAGLRAAGRGINDAVVRPLSTLANRENEATLRLSKALAQDRSTGGTMAAGVERTANDAGAEVLNADRFGSAIRTLARTASNVSPEAKNVFDEVTQQRFLTQGNRAANFVNRLMGGATDDLALQDRLLAAAKATNKVNYDAARNAPNAKALFTPKIRGLLSSDIVKSAVKEADTVGTDYAALTGTPAVKNPFTFDESGNLLGLRQLPGGGYALPNLEFWDVVQRNLRGVADKAKRAGDMELASRAGQLRRELLAELDGAVPQFKAARQGAAGFFGAEDAIEAGRKAVNSTKSVPEIERAVAAMTPAEKDAFSVGFSSEIIDAIGATRDRVNVINSIFGSESARRRISIALGPQKARELEAYVKMEQTLDMLRTAVQGNSTTTQQLIAAGVLGGAGGTILSGGDLMQGANWALIAGVGRRGAQMLGKRVDDQVMKRVAEVLSSGDPALLERAIRNASLSKQHMDALDAIMRGLALTSRGAGAGVLATGSAE